MHVQCHVQLHFSSSQVGDLLEESGVGGPDLLDEVEVLRSLTTFLVSYSVETSRESRLPVLVLRVGGGAYDTTEQLKVVGTHLCTCVCERRESV